MTADSINILGEFCGKRDIDELTSAELMAKYGLQQADLFVLFGGSILCGGDVLAKAIENHVAGKYIIVGGAGHTTQTLRDKMKEVLSGIETGDLSEAELFNIYLKTRYSLEADYLETRSTNCGNNITNLLDLIKENKLKCQSIILSQDAAMQLRMTATLKKYRPEIQVINYAVYKADVREENGIMSYASPVWGMWDMERYISLLLGEIPRLTDDENGYGPKGKGFIAHVDIPPDVRAAFDELKSRYPELVRKANPEFAAINDKVSSIKA